MIMATFMSMLRIAFRDLRGGVRGIAVFLGCLALGVAATTAVGVTARGLQEGLTREGSAILGGDIAFALAHREATVSERQWLDGLGATSIAANLRAMVRSESGSEQALSEVKAVDGAYPLAGAFVLEPPIAPRDLFAPRHGVQGAAAEAALAARLGVQVGDRLRLGSLVIELRAILRHEPDKLASGIGFGPRLLVSQATLRDSGLLQPGSLVRWHYRVIIPGASDATLDRVAAEAAQLFPDAGWEIRSRRNASPQVARNIDRFTQFLVLVGLTALVVGGVGIASAVRAHVDSRLNTIATLKAIGASGARITAIYAIQVVILAAIGISIGLVTGVLLPAGVLAVLADMIPIPVLVAPYPRELALAAAFGALVTMAFAMWPLGRAHDVSVQALYRDRVAVKLRRPRLGYVVLSFGAVALLIGLSLGLAADIRLAAMFAAGVAAAFLVLRAVASGIMAVARRLPSPHSATARLALTSIARPGAITPTVVLALGLVLTLLVTLALIEGNLRRQLVSQLPERAPSFFFLDVPSDELTDVRTLVHQRAPNARFESVPMLRGRIVSVKGVPAERAPATPQSAWVLNGDRGITYAERPPENARIVSGSWWTADHTGPPHVSFDARIAEGLGLSIGDRIVVNVLGRTIEATLANTRTVQWETLGINFVMVFSPNTFRGAPHMHLATVTTPGGASTETELALLRSVTDAHATITAIRVKEALDAVNALLSQLAIAARGAASVALLAAILVLAGALAAGHHARILDAVILRTLGATRARLVAAFALEYTLIGLATAAFAFAAGTVAAWAVVGRIMNLPFAATPEVAVGAVVVALAVTVSLGLIGTWRVLRHKPAPVLRSL